MTKATVGQIVHYVGKTQKHHGHTAEIYRVRRDKYIYMYQVKCECGERPYWFSSSFSVEVPALV